MKKKILILVSILVVFLAIPPFVNYWVSTPSSIGFIPIEKQEVWISFYASLIGSGITLLGVALTICYTDFTRKEDFRKHEQELKEEYEKRNNDTKINLSAQYKPILTVTFDSNYIDDMINSTTYRLVDLPNGEELRAQAQKEFNLTDSETKALANYKLYGNLDKGVVRGFEVNAATNLGAGFSLNGNYAYAYARGKSVDGIWGNIDRSVRHTGTVAGNYTHAWNDYMLNVNINGRFQSKRFHPGHSYGDAPGYGVWNLNVKHSLTGFQHLGLDFGMGLDNIFNKRDTRPNGVNYALLSPGRMAYVSLTLRFKK